MPITEEEKAALSAKRGSLAANIPDYKTRIKFIAEQGDVDKAGGKDVDYAGLMQKTSGEEQSQALSGQYALPRAARAKEQ
jgi:hypothetical protein